MLLIVLDRYNLAFVYVLHFVPSFYNYINYIIIYITAGNIWINEFQHKESYSSHLRCTVLPL